LIPYASFYKGIAFMELDEMAAAETALTAIIKQSPTFSLIEDTKWYLALAYLKQEKIATAYSLLKELKQSPTYKDRATVLLENYQ